MPYTYRRPWLTRAEAIRFAYIVAAFALSFGIAAYGGMEPHALWAWVAGTAVGAVVLTFPVFLVAACIGHAVALIIRRLTNGTE